MPFKALSGGAIYLILLFRLGLPWRYYITFEPLFRRSEQPALLRLQSRAALEHCPVHFEDFLSVGHSLGICLDLTSDWVSCRMSEARQGTTGWDVVASWVSPL